jgi:FMN phosphatase YigB (HAD superfamily)
MQMIYSKGEEIAAPTSSLGIVGLDVGGVLILSPWELLSQLQPTLTETAPYLFGPFSGGADMTYEAMLSGKVSEMQYWENFASQARREVPDLAGSSNPVRDLLLAFQHPVRQSMLVWMRSFVAQGGRVLTFSNGLYRHLGRTWWVDNVPTTLVEAHFDASETGIRKPDPNVFVPLVSLSNCAPNTRVLYVDDNPHYIRAAESVGIPGIWFLAAREQMCLEQLTAFYGMRVNER